MGANNDAGASHPLSCLGRCCINSFVGFDGPTVSAYDRREIDRFE
jgi:hypothetical protein